MELTPFVTKSRRHFELDRSNIVLVLHRFYDPRSVYAAYHRWPCNFLHDNGDTGNQDKEHEVHAGCAAGYKPVTRRGRSTEHFTFVVATQLPPGIFTAIVRHSRACITASLFLHAAPRAFVLFGRRTCTLPMQRSIVLQALRPASCGCFVRCCMMIICDGSLKNDREQRFLLRKCTHRLVTSTR